LFIFVIAIMVVWFYAIGKLSIEFKKASEAKENK